MADSVVKVIIQGDDQTQRAFGSVRQGLAALGGTILGNQGFSMLKTQFNDAVDSSNKLQNSLLGLDSVARAFTGQTDKAQQAAKDLAADGLMPISDAATSLKNLLAAGFGLDEAITLMNRFKDSAAFGRQGSLDFGESIRGATEGIKNGNSILVDNAGVTKNLSVMLEEAGYSAQDLMKASQDGGVRQAIYNGILRETNAQLGDASKLSSTFSGAQARLGTVIFSTKAQIGDVLKGGVAPLVSGLTEWLSANQKVVVSLALAGGAVLGFLTILAGGAGLVGGIMLVVGALGGPLTIALLAISLLLGGVVFGAMQKMQDKMADTAKTTSAATGGIGKAAQSGLGKAGEAAKDLAKKLEDIDRSAKVAERDFRESMARMIQDHETKAKDLMGQINDENTANSDANKQRETDYNDSLQQMKDDHEKKTRDIGEQIDAESAKGVFANRKTLDDLRQRLANENDDYTKHFTDLTQKYAEDTAKQKKEHDDKLTALQTELDAEQALLNKHADDKRAIQGVMLLDEIDNLKRSHDEQMQAFDRQRKDAIDSAKKTTAGMADAYNGLPNLVDKNAMSNVGGLMGAQMAQAFKDAFITPVKNYFNNLPSDLIDVLTMGMSFGDPQLANKFRAQGKKMGIPGFASGVTNFQGGLAYVHQGEMLVNMPRGTDVKTAAEVKQMGGGDGMNVTQHIYNQVDMDAGFAELAWRRKVA